jgi:tetratricopeptide (TPR) repeat protein
LKRAAVIIAALAACTIVGRAATQLSADDASVQLELATQFVQEGRFLEALDALDLATRSDDQALVARARKARVRAALRIAKFDVARRDGELLSESAPDDPEAQTLYGDALWAKGMFDEADGQYRKALAGAPESSRARFGLARSLATRTNLDEALTEALAAVASAPRDPEIHALLGHVYERLRKFDDAANAYEQYVALLPNPLESSAGVFIARVKLLRSFKGKPPLQLDEERRGMPAAAYRVPFKLVNKKILMQGRLNNVPVEFVLDTGSERTGVSRETARRAGITAVTTTLTAGVGVATLAKLDLGRADRIEIGKLRMRNVPVAIRSQGLSGLPRWQSESFSPISLGMSVVVDYKRQEVILARTLPEGDADFRLPMRVNRLPMVRGLLNSQHPTYFVVDTGGEMISISADTANGLEMPLPSRRIALRVFGMSGMDADAFLMPGIDLNFDAIEYRKVGLAVLNLRAPSVLLGFELGGIVGHKFLGDYRVWMDVARSELRLEKF